MKCRHTKHPTGYLEHSDWREKKSVKHKQIQCPNCGLWAIWVRKSTLEKKEKKKKINAFIEVLQEVIEVAHDCNSWSIDKVVDTPVGTKHECEVNLFDHQYIDQHQHWDDDYYGSIYLPLNEKYLKINYHT